MDTSSNDGTDVKQQVIAEIRSFPIFPVQLDKSTDVASCSQLLVFVRCIHKEDVKEEFLYCNSLETTATAQDVMNNISKFYQRQGLQWEKLCGVCTDGALAMLECKSGFQMKVKERKCDDIDVGTGGEQQEALVPLNSEFFM